MVTSRLAPALSCLLQISLVSKCDNYQGTKLVTKQPDRGQVLRNPEVTVFYVSVSYLRQSHRKKKKIHTYHPLNL